MPELKLKQLEFESATWKRLLDFIIDENIHLKNRLSEMVKYVLDKNVLEEMENYHSSFLKQDELVVLLRNDIAELDRLFLKETFEDGKIIIEIHRNVKKLRGNIIVAENQFNTLKLQFNNYLSELLSDTDRKNYFSHN